MPSHKAVMAVSSSVKPRQQMMTAFSHFGLGRKIPGPFSHRGAAHLPDCRIVHSQGWEEPISDLATGNSSSFYVSAIYQFVRCEKCKKRKNYEE